MPTSVTGVLCMPGVAVLWASPLNTTGSLLQDCCKGSVQEEDNDTGELTNFGDAAEETCVSAP